jgi:hypothetical protein
MEPDYVKNNIENLYKNPEITQNIIERNYGFIKDNLALVLIKI